MAIETIALHWLPAGFPDGVFKRRYSLLLRSSCARHVENFFLQNCAVQIIHAVAKRDLRETQAQADPVGGEMLNVIEINTAHRKIAKLLKRRRPFYVSEDPVGLGRLEGKRNKTSETA